MGRLRFAPHWYLVFGFMFGFWSLVFGISRAEDFTYSSRGKRDPFVPLVGPGAVYQVKEAIDINSIEDVALEGIVYDDKGDSRAIINGMILKEDDQAGAVVIDKIEPKKVILLIGEDRHEVTLSQEKGGGGKWKN
ncbi:MAG: hypothetical protein HY589_01310 [Candidatus Omnitrophica bacterium]|nr:hypothetical protein [Candidatus Omnitrophota bacterium]